MAWMLDAGTVAPCDGLQDRTADILSALDLRGTKTLQPKPEPLSSLVAQSGPEARAPTAKFMAGKLVQKEQKWSHEPLAEAVFKTA